MYYVLNGNSFDVNIPQVVGDVQYPAGWFMDAECRSGCGIEVGIGTTPTFNSVTQVAKEVPPIQVDGTWTQQWEITNLTQNEILARTKSLVPQQVTMRQARLALLQAGLYASVNSTIANMTGEIGDAARIEWEYSHTVMRHYPLITSLATALNLTDEQLDALFIQAAQL